MKKVLVQFDGITYLVTDMKGVYETECVDYEALEKYLTDHNMDIHGAIIDNEED